MKRSWRNWFNFVLLLAAATVMAAAQEQPLPEAKALLERTAFPSLETAAPIRLHARFTIKNLRSTHKGEFTFTAPSANEFRREFVVGDYREVHTYKDGKLYIQRPEREPPPALWSIAKHIDFGRPFDTREYEVKGDVKRRNIKNAGDAACFDVKKKSINTTLNMCYYLPAAVPMASRDADARYYDYQDFTGLILPRRIVVGEDWVEVEIDDVSREKLPALTAPSAATLTFDTCAFPTQPALKFRVAPRYTLDALRRNAQGVVYLWGILGKDGRWKELKTIGAPNLLSDSTYAAVQRWEYEPAICGDAPVETDLVITVKFSLHR